MASEQRRASVRRRGILAIAIVTGMLVAGAVIGAGTGSLVRFDAHVGGPQALLAWLARGVLLLALAWLVIGMLAARTRLVRRPGAAAARATWIASTRPWRARESSLGVLETDRVLMVAVPVALLIGTRVLEASFTAWLALAAVLSGWIVFAAVVRVLIGQQSPWPFAVAAGGSIVLHSTVVLIPMAVAGPAAAWAAVEDSAPLGIVASAVFIAATGWILVSSGWALAEQLGARRAWGTVLAGAGAGVAVTLAMTAGGMATAARPFDVPAPTPWVLAAVGALVAVVGLLLALVRPSSRGTPRE